MATLVLVHGSWLGGWAWERVVPGLRALGHTVFCPSLAPAAPGVGLRTHIAEIVALIDRHGLTDVVLVGHSYGGMVITGAGYERPRRIRQLTYLDAYFPSPGQSAFDLQPVLREACDAAAALRPEGEAWLIPPFGFEAMGLAAGDLEQVTARARPLSRATHEEPLPGPASGHPHPPATYIRFGGSPYFADAAHTALRRGARLLTIEGAAHLAPLTDPERVRAALDRSR
ncbi:alpha/beta fold hydrolase [Streptomyces lichenis]|uniref:Alpha/beta hydrolase n=1 Tax=Streptomyces lichenis TaxID=2306967 RepID=A0ABT0IBQ7_9ACTN|nr:alpha/beta hydrolase [Streptomyces lichenis]MCK8678751.1 alpha/beta hydrolase [Streptomyces lichenis]